jgi:hypothetical protein
VLDHVWRVLKPGGAIFVATPSLDSWSARWMRERWMEFKAEHLFFFDRATLESALVRAGFEDIRIDRGKKTLSPVKCSITFSDSRARPLAARARHERAPARPLRRQRVRVVASGIDAVARRSANPPSIGDAPSGLRRDAGLQREKTFNEVIGPLLREGDSGSRPRSRHRREQLNGRHEGGVRKVESHPRVKVIWQERPRGKGNGVRAAWRRPRATSCSFKTPTSNTTSPTTRCCRAAPKFRAAFVLGIRHGRDGGSWKVRHFTDQVLLGQWMNFGHVLFTALFNVVYGQRLRDPFTM